MIELESKLQAKIIKYLKTRPNTVTYKHPPSPTGTPDVIHIEQGHAFYFEVKRTKKDKPRPDQKYRIMKLNKAGATAKVVRSVDEVKQIVRKRFING